jgi:threonine dehydratase
VNRRLIEEAAQRIAGRVRRTPVMSLDLDGIEVVAKLELLQHTGSFKPRGAFNRVLAEASVPEAGLITASGGNHGAAVAFVAHQLGLAAEVFVAEVTPALKRERIASLGARVVIGGRQYPDALEASHLRAAETGALEVHAYDHELTVAGQGTMGIELEEQVAGLDTVIMSVGGGGFAAGTAAWFADRARVVCVEPLGSRALDAALAAGHPVDVEIDSVASDSLGARRIGDVPFGVLRHTESVLVTDRAIVDAQRWLWDRMRLVVEPGGAAATAAVLSGAYRPEPGERVVVVVCGSNTDPATVI